MNETDRKLMQAKNTLEFDRIAIEAGWYGPDQWPEEVKQHRKYLLNTPGKNAGKFEDGDPNGAFVNRERK